MSRRWFRRVQSASPPEKSGVFGGNPWGARLVQKTRSSSRSSSSTPKRRVTPLPTKACLIFAPVGGDKTRRELITKKVREIEESIQLGANAKLRHYASRSTSGCWLGTS